MTPGIIGTCAACAEPIPLTAKGCAHCKTRYCGPECQKKHWKEGGHKELCKKITRHGGAEKYHATKKCAEAVAVAARACAEETEGQTCYICTEGIKRDTGEGLVRMCACRGTAGFAHVTCLAEEAKILWASAEGNNNATARMAALQRWYICRLCEQEYHGLVRCALGWACWMTYLDRPVTASIRINAITFLGSSLTCSREQYVEALAVFDAHLAILRRYFPNNAGERLSVQTNIADSLFQLANQYPISPERAEEALKLHREIFAEKQLRWNLSRDRQMQDTEQLLLSVLNVGGVICFLAPRGGSPESLREAVALAREYGPIAQRLLGPNHDYTFRLRVLDAQSTILDSIGADDDRRAAAKALAEDIIRSARRVFGPNHPDVENYAGVFAEALGWNADWSSNTWLEAGRPL